MHYGKQIINVGIKMKKIINYQKICIVLFVLLIVFLSFRSCWNVVLSNVIPWTRTAFSDHESYLDLLDDRHCFGVIHFSQEIPDEAENIVYYWHQDKWEHYTAYSVQLGKKQYEEVVANRLSAYRREMDGCEDDIVYEWKGAPHTYIETSRWYEEEKLHYIDKLMRHPGAKQQYYFLIVVCYNTSTGTSYCGVILNDITQEMIEFCFELKDEEPERNESQPSMRPLF